MNIGMWLCAPPSVDIAICGFIVGDVPPTAGCAWQPAQLSKLNRGPSPSGAPLGVEKEAAPSVKNFGSTPVKPAIALPAPGAPARTPGSFALVSSSSAQAAHAIPKLNVPAAAPARRLIDLLFIVSPESYLLVCLITV